MKCNSNHLGKEEVMEEDITDFLEKLWVCFPNLRPKPFDLNTDSIKEEIEAIIKQENNR